MNRRERTMRDGSNPRSRRTPSFSSSLLDAIYRSTDQSKSDLDIDSKLGLCNEVNCKKQSNVCYNGGFSPVNEYRRVSNMNRLRRTVIVEDWMEKQSSHSSSDYSSGGFFSSSETETSCKQRSRSKSDKSMMKTEKQKKQRVKQPMSPGSRIASFLSSIFNYGSVKKAKMCYVGATEDVDFEQKSQSPFVSSSASSCSRRSCMSKTSSSAKKNNGVKRSVRFYPVSIILGEDSHHKFVYENDPDIRPLPSGVGKITRSSSTKEEEEERRKKKKNSVLTREYDSRIIHKFVYGNDPDIRPFPSGVGKITRSSSTKEEEEERRKKKKNSVLTRENDSRKIRKFVYENDPDIRPLPSGVGKITRSSSTKEEEEEEERRKKKKSSVLTRENDSRKSEFDFRMLYNHNNGEDDEDEDNDALSCSSSDLFELDHLIGGGRRYQEELPVYETTNLQRNKAIANGLRL